MTKLFVFAVAAAALVATPASAGDQDFTLVNRTGYTIEKVYVSPHNTKSWQEDVMGDDVLEDGASQPIAFSRSEETCMWDLKAVYDDGDTAEWGNINLCKVSTITVFYNAKTNTTSAKYE